MVFQKKKKNKSPFRNRGKKLIQNTEIKIPEMEAGSSNSESESDDHSRQNIVPVPSGSAGTSIKVTLKKTRSCSSSSSRGSTQSFKVVKSVSHASKSSTSEEDENEKDSDKLLPEDDDESEKDTENKLKTTVSDENLNEDNIVNIEISSDDESEKSFSERPTPVVSIKSEKKDNKNISLNDNIEISSDESEKSFTGRPNPVVPVKDEINDDKTVPLNTEVDLKTENVPQNFFIEKKEEYKLKIKPLIEEELRKDDSNDVPTFKAQNGVEVKKPVNEHKFKVNVRSSDELYSPHKSNLINIPPPGQLHGQPNFLSQNGVQFPPPPFMPCDVCGIQFDSSELLNDHKVALKHFKCSFKDCEHLLFSSQQEFLDHQRLIHSIMPSPVQQLAHQVQNLPAMGFDQLLQSGVPPLPDNLPPPPGVPNIYTQTLRMPSQPVPMQRPMRPITRPTMSPMMSTRGRSVQRGLSRGRPVSMNPSMGRGASMKRPASMPLRGSPTIKRTPTDRNYSNNLNKTAQIAKCLSQSLTKPISSAAHKPQPNNATQQDVVNLFSKRGLTISTVETIGNSSVTLPAGISLNSAVTIIPTSPHKVPNNVPLKVANQTTSYKVSNVPRKNVDLVDLTGSESKLWPCEVCSKTYSSIESLYEHVSTLHKSHSFSFKCNFCKLSFPNAEMLRQHKLVNHKQETNSSIPFVIPILDISKSSTVAKLQAMGVTNYVPVAQLDSQGSQYGVPIMNISRPGSVDGLKYTNFFNLGSIRKL